MILSTVIRHQHWAQGEEKKKFDHSYLHIFYIGPSIITSLWRPDVWSFFPACFPLMNEKTMKLSTCMWPHWVRGWEEETGTDHRLQHTQWKSLIASHFRLKGGKRRNDEESRVYVTRKMTPMTLRKIYIFFFFLFLKYTAGGRREERSRRQMFSGRFIKRCDFFWQYYKHLGC